jgi:hypothetical protein
MRKLPLAALIATLAGLSAAPVAQAKRGPFQSPTGNIGCYIDTGFVRCDIALHDWATPKRPKSCELDYGQGLAVDKSGRAGFVCAGDTTLHQGPVLGYGHSRSAGRFTCVSKAAGMTCRNRNNGHGFFLSRQSYRRF